VGRDRKLECVSGVGKYGWEGQRLSYGGRTGRPTRPRCQTTPERFLLTWLFRIRAFVTGTDGDDRLCQVQSSIHFGIARAKKEGEPRRTLPLLGHARNAALAALRASAGDAPCSTRALIAARWLGRSVPTTRRAEQVMVGRDLAHEFLPSAKNRDTIAEKSELASSRPSSQS
jgi:hypothetical protein